MADFDSIYQYIEEGNSPATTIIGVVLCVLLIIAQWKMFEKAGEGGWKSLIPFYNVYTLVKIVDGNGLKFLLFIIPIVNVVYYFILCFRTAKAYGKGTGFGIGLLLLPNVFTLILGFGSARYQGPRG